MIKKQVKSKERVNQHAEVFTDEREVNAMLDMVKQETERIDSRFLEPACGDGNFLSEVLKRKLNIVKKKYKKSSFDYERNSVLAISSIYGVDILMDNVVECRKRLYAIWDKEYSDNCKKECNNMTREAVKYILNKNIVCGNALSLRKVDNEGEDTKEPIVFSEWAFITGTQMQRKDYTFDEILNGNNEKKVQQTFEDKIGKQDDEGLFLKQYISHYRRVQKND